MVGRFRRPGGWPASRSTVWRCLSAMVERIYSPPGEEERVWIGALKRVASGTPCRAALLQLPLAESCLNAL